MPRLMILLSGITTLSMLAGCPATPAPAPPPGAAGGTGGTEVTNVEGSAGEVDDGDTGIASDTAAAGFESPEEAFAAAQQAARQSDWRTLVECMTPEGQQFLAGVMMFAVAFGGEETAVLMPVLEKHGVEVPEPEFSVTVGEGADGQPETPEEPEIEDLPGFIADMIAAMDASGMDTGSGTGPDQWGNAELTEVSIDGDSASGTLVIETDDGEQTEPIAFTKTDAGWLLDVSVTAGPGGPMVGDPSFDPEGPAEPLAETVLEDGLTSTIDLTFEQPFESQFFGTEFADGTLYATVKLSGEPVTNAYEYGEFQLVAAEDSTGAALELAAPIKDKYGNEFGEEFVDTFYLDRKDTLPLLFALTPPGDGAEQLSTLELSVKLKVRESTVVKDVLASLGDSITVEDVGEFAINKQDADNGNPDHGLQIEFKSSGAGVEDITLLDGDGQPLDTEGSFGFGFGNSKTFGISTSGPLPEDTQMRVTLEGSESVKVVPLKLEDLELER